MTGPAVRSSVRLRRPAGPPDRAADLLLAGGEIEIESLRAFLQEVAAESLGLPPGAVDAERPLASFGLDSLSAVELQGRVEATLRVPLPLADLLAGATVRELAETLHAALAERTEREAAGGGEESAGAAVALPASGDVPLSAGQRALWFLERLAPEAGAYNIAVAARAHGLDVAALRRALERLVPRHPALRTVFPTLPGEAGEPVQRVLAPAETPGLDFAKVDAAGWSERELRARLAAEAWRPFDLARGPLLRVRVYERADGERVLLFAIHHLIADFASLGLAARELGALYRGAADLPALPASYADFVRAQTARLAGSEGERLWDFWRAALDGVSDLELPTDRPRPPVQTWRGLARGTEISAGLAARLRRLAAVEGATLFALLAAAWQVQLGRYAGEESFAIGTPTAGRGAPEWAGVFGYFVNPVALRADLTGDPAFGSLLARTRRTALAALEHASFPFVLVAERLRPRRDPARAPLFQVLFTFQQGRPGDAPGLAAFALGRDGARVRLGDGLELASVALPERRAQFELSFAAAELPAGDTGGIGLSLEANADLFDAATVERMIGHLKTLLEAAADHPCTRISELPLLSAPERQQLLREWNDTAVDFPAGARLSDLVAAQAERTPDAVAVVGTGGERLSYGALVARAQGLAAALRAQGIGRESRVGLCLARGPELIAAILGILEAGGAYVPLDPAYPAERLEWMLTDSGAELLVTEPAFVERFGFYNGETVFLDDSSASRPSPLGGGRLGMGGGQEGGASDRDLAYVIYTSGSTGKPKGVGIEHRSAVTLVRWALSSYSATELSGVLAATSVCFDLSIFEIFVPLAAGGRVIVAPDVLALPRLVAVGPGAEVTLLNTVPSPMSEIADGTLPPGLKTINLAGEALKPELAARLHAHPRIERVVNLYGPSEDTTYSTGAMVPRGAALVPIGRPLANRRARVLGRSLAEPLPAGVPGELVVAGDGLARGYLGQPEKTAERFVPDPWGPPGARMYRTGDRARLLPEGQLDFLGRLDDQVKIRGFRVEPGEVEATLALHPGVREAAVLAPLVHGERRLIACVVPLEPGQPPGDLRDFLAVRLIAAMIPSAWLVLPALPRNRSGKVDRAALAREIEERLSGSSGESAAHAPPVGPTEELLAGLWAELLGRPRVGRHDDFFALGGHSLLATRAVARLSRLFGVDLPVSALFAAPTVERLAARLAAASAAAAPPMVSLRREPGAPLPLSFAQRRLWFLEQLTPGTPLYNLPGALRLTGPLDLAALAAALAAVVRRHEALRTAFRIEGGEPMARLVPAALAAAALPVVDLSGLPGASRNAAAERLATAEARRPFGLAGLASGALLRTLLLRLAAAEHLLLATFHHLAADGWSLGLFLDELATLYAAGSPPALPVQYADFAAWQARWLEGEALAPQLAYWRERLAGLPVLDLPSDRPRPAARDARSVQGARRALLVVAEEAAAVAQLARREGVTLFMALLAAFQALLARLTGETRIPVGSPVANRRRPEVERLIGLFVNTLVLDVEVGDDPAFSTLLARVRAACLGAYAHQDLPFERLVEVLQPGRDPAQNPLFQVMLALEEPLPDRAVGDLTLEPVRGDSGTAKFDLLLAVAPHADGSWELAAEVPAALFEPITVDRLLGQFRRLLEGAWSLPATRLAELPLLSAAERQQLLAEWNDTARSGLRPPLVHELVAREARTRPAALAVAAPAGRLTYGELTTRAERLARRLRALGVGPEVRVALCAGRSPARVVGALAVWKAGGAFVSLDPEYPRERLAFVVDDARAPVLLTEERFRDRMPETGATVLCLDREEDLGSPDAKGPGTNPDVAPENLAYVIYTSGSTGTPKGVEIPHAGLSHMVRWYQRFHGVTSEDRGTQVASPAFDASIFELWPYLATGASVHIPDDEARLSLPGMLRWWAEEEITLPFIPTLLVDSMEEALPDRLRVRALLTGGDRLHRRPRPGAGFRLVNHYGPTEYSVVTTAGEVRSGEELALPSIGRPIDDTRLYLLDRWGGPVAAGAPGEIHIAGRGLARGYHGRPEWTAERFLPDPWSGEPGGRMYRTGDLARLLPDGELDFLGRVDQQVKVRGVRIELGEIEAALAAHPGVREAVAIARDDGPGGVRLVAYVVSVPGAGRDPAELRAFLAARLPEPMVPSAFVFLGALPATVHGKVDRQALPAPERQAEADFVAPRNPVEERVAAVFRAVLGIERMGVHDNFFALGGHSLLATRAAFQLSAAAEVHVPVTALFQAPTVAELAEWLERAEAPAGAAPVSAGALETGPYPLSLAQRRLWFLALLEPGSALHNVSVALRLDGRIDASALDRALAGIVRRHEPLRTLYAEQGGEPVQIVLPPSTASPLVRLSLRALPEPARSAALDALLAEEERLPFDLERGPVYRFRLVELGPEEQVLAATFHHIATDGWSMGVFARELGALYAGSPLPELPLSYGDFARRERRDLERGALESQLGFWRGHLADLPVLELPADRRPPHPGPRAASLPFDLPPDLAADLAAFGRNARGGGLTPFMVLLSGFAALLSRLSGQSDFGIGVPSAGRSRPETEGLIGFFVDTLVLRPGLSGDPSFGTLALRVQGELLAAQANEEVPFDKLVEELQPERAPGLTPFFQAMFAFLQDPAAALSLPGLSATLLTREAPFAEFDLTLSFYEWEGRLRGAFQVRADLFDRSTVARWAGHLRTLLAGAAADPAQPLSALPLLSAAERRQLQEWSGEPVASLPATLHRRFEEQARRTPDALALLSGEAALSYGELEARANRLARHLLGSGLAPEARIAVCLERSADLDLVLLAVWKAGGVHLPLDPSYPPERMRVILEDAGAAVLVSREEAISRLPLDGLPAAPVTVLLDRDAAAIARQEARPPDVPVDPGALAYVIYTSGSTGRPKGVGVPHGAAVAHVDSVRRAYGIGPGDRALQFSSPGFDVSIEQVMVALGAGATVVVRGAELWTPLEMTRRIAELELTYLDLPTAYWNRWASEAGDPEEGADRGPLPLRLVVAGGEEMPAGSVRRWWRSPLAGVRLLNGYGPTEVVVTVTLHEVRPEDGAAADRRPLAPVPLGRPVPGNSVRVLDRAGNPQPVGVPGEIAVDGPQARGYLERPERTAERFVPDPFSGEPGARLYKTGDRGRTRADGRIEFLGRIDEQVKVRGFRIELGEVEAALTRHPAVREAAVAAIPAPGGRERTLAAWVVPAEERVEDLVAVVRADLSALLPEYMVPTAWVVLGALPVNAHGKVDRRALPPPVVAVPGGVGDIAGRAPESPEEELLGDLYAELLDRPRVGMDESFFDLGGHSLLATQVVSRVRAVFGVELPLAAVFESPTPAALARRLAALRRARATQGDEPPLARSTDGGPAPLSFAQQRLWFLSQLEPDDAYHVPGALRLSGPLREAVLARALAEIVRRHAALRTVFRVAGAGSGAVQVVPPPPAGITLPVADLAALPPAAREAEAARLLAVHGHLPFDLAAGPLVRTLLLRLAAGPGGERLLSVVMHHITSDAWSLGILLAELQALYTAFLRAAPSPLPELPLQYPDYARWQRRFLAGEVLEREVEHWRRALAGVPESLALPYDRPPAPGAGNRGGRRPVVLGADLHGRLAALARREGWTAFMALLAGFQAFLARITGQDDLVVGSPIANRTRPEVSRLIGFFTNTVALRLDLAGDPSFRTLGRRVRAAALDAYAHQDLPFEKLVLELAPDRHLGRNPLFQVMLVHQRLPPRPALPGVEVELVDVDTGTAKFDLTLTLFEEGGGATAGSGSMEYAQALFDAATVDRLLGSFRTLLEGTVADPEARLSDLPLLSAAERAELAAWTRPLRPAAPPLLVHAAVVEQAERAPDALAVAAPGIALSYGALVARAHRLARRLQSLGVGPDVPVGLHLERSPDAMVAVLGVLLAGGAYLPLDPSYPAERLRAMLEDAAAPVVVSHRPLAGAVPSGPHSVVRVDELPSDDAPLPASGVTPEHLAYAVYTSGSTGRPKGVAMSHGAISAMLLWQLRTSRAGTGRTLQFTSLSFDVSFQEIFSTWWAGGALVLVGEDVRRDPPALARLLAAERVERLFLPFVALQQLAIAASDGAPEAFPDALREVMSAGEQLQVTPPVVALFARLPGAVLYNHYGPSEAHAVTWLALTGDAAAWPERPAIGVPVDHARVFFLDPLGMGFQPVPPGVAGEVWVGGAGLARGYLGRPDWTAERFLPDPFDQVAGWRPGDRLYRTGDLARRRPDGYAEYFGRIDAQVKIRGHRVELSEVEAALARHPAVEQAAVAVRDGGGTRRLTAYVVLREGAPPPGFGALRAFLAESLPDPMVPTAWARLDALPLTATGKLDRRALSRLAPEEGSGGEDGRGSFAAPRTPVEELLAGIWREVLGVSRVSVDDDFFALGGHSLLATQVASRLRSTFGVEVPLKRIFEAPTVSGLAAAVSATLAARAGAAEAAPPPLRPAPREGDLPLSFAQERLWFLDRLQPGGAAYNIPLVLSVAGRLDPSRLAAAFSGLVRRHEVLRTVFAERDGAPVQVVLPAISAGAVPVPVVDLGALPEEARTIEARRIAAAESARPFDLARGPLLRVALLQLEPARDLLFVGLHHIVADGWSLGVLVRELRALYAGESLPELAIQYADFALWQRRWLAGPALERQLAWWRERLAGAPATLDLPADHPRPPVQTQRGAELRFSLPAGLAGRLSALAAEEGATPFMVLAAGLFALLGRLSGQADLVVGSPIANRHHRELEELIGFFVNTLALRVDLARAATFGDLVRQVREVSLGAYAHQDLPFEKLVDELQPDRDLSRSPLFQVAFALQNAPLPAADLGGVPLTPEELPGEVAKFDLSFVLTGEPGSLWGALQYATDLFEAPTAARLAGHFTTLLASLAAGPGAPLAAAGLLSAAERHQLLREWNDTAAPVVPGTLHGPFLARAAERPDAVAAVWEADHVTYGALAARAARLARLLGELGVSPGTPVGVWMERSPELVAAALGILQAGGHYLPIDPAWPAERAEAILAGARAPVVVAGAAQLPTARDLQWRLPVTDLVCPEVSTPRPPAEPLEAGEVRALWDFVAERATDRESAGGFVSSYTGLPFSAAEVDQYRDRVLALAAPWLVPGARVLEIGCGAGLLLWAMAPRVGRAVGLDPSPLTQEKNRAHAAAHGLGNVELRTGFAHELDAIEGEFDLVLMASTAQFFPGPGYLEEVVAKALARLATGGALLVADVPDARRREEFRRSVAAASAAGASGKPGEGRERWWDAEQFRALGAELPGVAEVAVLPRPEGPEVDDGFANELRFRYDVLFTHGTPATPPRRPEKRLWTGWHLARRPASVLPESSPDDLAYVIHTSGSTGAPKGIGVAHRAAAHLVGWANATHGVGPEDRLLFITSLGFDLSVYDLFGTLAAGGTIEIAPEAALRDPDRLARLLVLRAATVWDSAPAALQQLVPYFAAAPALASPLRLVLLSGDWIPVRLPDQVRAAFPRAKVISLGGATEATVWSNRYPIGAVDPRWPSIPYGRPIANASYHVLDVEGSPCPIGIPGDLYIGERGETDGAVLSVGYVYQPVQTALSFVPDPFATQPGARLYRTGDRARYGADGNLEFLGRMDHQVKVRGYRIELGEIELALARHPAVREAVVLAREDVPGEKRLVGYVVPSGEAPGELSVEALRTFLQASLPEYMVPWSFVFLAALPVTPNGKLDREALPAPPDAAAAGVAYVTPRSDLERAIGAVWCEVLGRERIGVQESFFTVGGSSLLLARLQVRLRQALGRDIPFVELFKHPTIEGLAKSLGEAAPGSEARTERVERVRARSEGRRESLRQVGERGQRRRREPRGSGR